MNFRSLALLATVALVVTACGDEGIGFRYEADRSLWRLDRERERLPGAPVTRGRDARLELAERYETVGAEFETWANERSDDDPVVADVRATAARAWLRAAGLHAAVGDSFRLRAMLEDLVPRFEGPRIASVIHLRLADAAEVAGDSAVAAAALRVAWDSGARIPHWRPAHVDLPRRVATLDPAAGATDNVAWAVEEYRWLATRDRFHVAVDARLELATLLLDRRDAVAAVGVLDPVVNAIQTRDPDDEDASIDLAAMGRVVESFARAHGEGALEASRLVGVLDWCLDRRAPAGRLLMAVGRSFADRGDVDTALDVLDRIIERHDDATWAPLALRESALLHSSRQEWDQAFVDWKLLGSKYALTEEAMAVPLELVRHHRRRGDEREAVEQLAHAEATFRRWRTRFPRGSHSAHLDELMADVLDRQGRFEDAYAERIAWIDRAEGSLTELHRLAATVEATEKTLLGPDRIDPLLRRMAERFPGTRLGRQAAARLASVEADTSAGGDPIGEIDERQ